MSELSQEAEMDLMYCSIGKAIHRWANVEHALGLVYSQCTGPSFGNNEGTIFFDADVGVAAFLSVENFRAKLSLLDTALAMRLKVCGDNGAHIAPLWEKLREKARKLSGRRNRLAHWTVTCYSREKQNRRVRLVPPIGSLLFHDQSAIHPGGHTISETCHWATAFMLLNERIHALSRELGALPELQSIYASQVGVLMRTVREDPNFLEPLKRALSWPQ